MKRKLRLLVVEDSDEDAFRLLRELERTYDIEHRQVWTREDTRAALREPWDVVISDWSMPEFSGREAFSMVRDAGLDLPFVIVSGTIDEDIAVDALTAGVHGFISKGQLARLVPTIDRELREVTQRQRQREAEAEVIRQAREIERSARLLRSVLDSVPDAVIVAGEQGQLLTWNTAASALLDIDPATRSWSNTGFYLPDRVTPVSPDDRPLAQALRGEVVVRQELVRRSSEDAGAWMSISARPLHDEAGVEGAVAVFRDISRERAAQEQLMISDRMASIGMLAAGVAHEINNPLAAVIANLDLAMSELADLQPRGSLEAVNEMLEDVRAAADRVKHIVRDLKIFSRDEETKDGAVDVHQMLDSMLRMAWNEIKHRARMVKEYGKDIPPVRGSESRLGQVFLNLIVNAAQAIPEGNAARNQIRVSTSVEGSNVIIEITDTGTGMSVETVRHLFTPFFTTNPPGIGTGLGLSISHSIVTSLGGELRIDSELGRGTTVQVVLPIAASIETETTTLIPICASRRAHVMVVDDEAIIAAAVRRLLARDHDVVIATRAIEGLHRIQSGERFDLILCDLMMPQMTGMELHDKIAAIDGDQAARMVFLTGGAFTPSARQFLDRVPNQRIEKPFDAQYLRVLVNDRVR
ncbi:MAG: response regulator [Deltaproteobacteria bacterium]|nr:response regulator [Deltaproteobacteria bacterium]